MNLNTLTLSISPRPIKQRKPSTLNLLLILLLIALVLFAYQSVVDGDFVWDDEFYIYNSPFIRDSSLWLSVSFKQFLIANYFRPLPILTFIIDYHLADGQPWIFHLTNLLLHLANTVLVVFLARRISIPDRDHAATILLPILAGLLYGLHPVLVEPVAWISGRFDLMATLFLLLALLLDGIKNTWGRILGIGSCFFLAALCKEMVVTFPIILVFWHLALSDCPPQHAARCFWQQGRKTGHLWIYLTLFMTGLIYLGVRYTALGYLMQSSADPYGPILNHLLLITKALGLYLSLILWPFSQLSPLHEQTFPVPLTDFGAWIALLTIATLLTVWIYWIRHWPRIFWLGLAFLISLAPVIHLLPLSIGHTIVHERFLTFPLALFLLTLLSGFQQFKTALPHWFATRQHRWLASTLLAFWFGLSILNIRITVPLWETSFRLWSWATQREPDSDYAKASLMQCYIYQGLLTKAKEIYATSNKIYPGLLLQYANLLLIEKQYLHAIEIYQKTLASFDNTREDILTKANILNSIGVAWFFSKDLDQAERYFLESIKTYPFLPETNLNLAELFINKNISDRAKYYLELGQNYAYHSPALQKRITHLSNLLYR